MPRGFFAPSLLVSSQPGGLLPKCGACGLFRGCQTPKMKPTGDGKRRILVVGEAPGKADDEKGIQFVGKYGERLEDEFNRLGSNMRDDCIVTNALICRPPGNRIPDPQKMPEYCRPNLLKTIADYKPHTIILLGGVAVRSLIGEQWKENPGALGRWVGFNIPDQKLNTWICPTYHPSYLERENNSVLDSYFRQHLEQALANEGRPWDPVPDWESQIEVLGVKEAAQALREMEREGGEIAIDIEGNCLKPETPNAQIVCCSVCHNGKRTIAYPWHGDAIQATKELIESNRIGCIAANMKHEDRWFFYFLGIRPRHWIFDTMLAGHVIDNREGGICGLKFQAYVELGLPGYDDHIKQFLKSVGKSKLNRVQDIDLTQLLKYCGFDTLLEYKLARRQNRRLTFRNAASN